MSEHPPYAAVSQFVVQASRLRKPGRRDACATKRKLKRKHMRTRSAVLSLLVALAVITYLDRVCISIAGKSMQDELKLSPQQWGWVVGIFSLSYGFFEIPTGALGDRFGRRRVLARIVLWWSAFTALTGFVSNYFLLLVVRFLFGAGEAGAYPNIAGVIGRWFRSAERARAQAAVWAASRVGGALSPYLVVPLMLLVGWRGVFVVFGAIGIVWAVAWLVLYRDPPTAQPKDVDSEADAPTHPPVPWGTLFGSRQMWLIMAMAWCYAWGSNFYLSWLHTYLVKGRGLPEEEMMHYSALPFALGIVGNLTGGFVSDRLSRAYGVRVGRRVVGSTGLAVAAVLFLTAAQTPDQITGVLILAVAYGVMDCMLPASWANCMDVGGRYAGAVSGAMNTAGQLGGFMSAVLFGYLAGWFGTYNAPLCVIAVMLSVSAVLFSHIDPSRPLAPETDVAPSEGAS
jgi:ACS family glucarate transporter-like MFS transporter